MSAARRSGFTLIELLAVVVIFGLLAGIALPNLGIRTSRLLDDESRGLASTLEFARQRAVMTGVPHRVVLDVEGGAYWLESYTTEAEFLGDDAPAAGPGPAQAAPGAPVEMSPPLGEERAFRVLVGTFGDLRTLDPEVFIAGVETPAGLFERGEVEVVFERDGTSAPTVVELGNEQGQAVFLHLAPLADTVRFERDAG